MKVNTTLCTAIVREMPDMPSGTPDWFKLFIATAEEMRTSMLAEGLTETAKSINGIIRHYRSEMKAAGIS